MILGRIGKGGGCLPNTETLPATFGEAYEEVVQWKTLFGCLGPSVGVEGVRLGEDRRVRVDEVGRLADWVLRSFLATTTRFDGSKLGGSAHSWRDQIVLVLQGLLRRHSWKAADWTKREPDTFLYTASLQTILDGA